MQSIWCNAESEEDEILCVESVQKDLDVRVTEPFWAQQS